MHEKAKEWSNDVTSIIETGRKLKQMKKDYNNEELAKKVYAELGISIHSINKVISISEHPIISDPKNASRLPASWALLYEIKFLPDDLLLQKIKEDTLKGLTKYHVWELRGVKSKKKPTVSNHWGGKIKIPDHISLVAYVSAAMQREGEFDNNLEAVAKSLGIGVWTYRQIRQIILLSRFPDLSNSDSELVQSMIDKINKTRNIQEYYFRLRPLIEKVWGVTQGQRVTIKGTQKRVQKYLNSIFILGMTAQKMFDMDRPYMSIEDTDKAIGELSEAGTRIRKLAEALRRSKND